MSESIPTGSPREARGVAVELRKVEVDLSGLVLRSDAAVLGSPQMVARIREIVRFRFDGIRSGFEREVCQVFVNEFQGETELLGIEAGVGCW